MASSYTTVSQIKHKVKESLFKTREPSYYCTYLTDMHAMYFIYISVSLYIYISFMYLDIGIPQITWFLYVYVSTNVPFHAFMHYAFYVQRQIIFEAFWIKKIYIVEKCRFTSSKFLFTISLA